MCCSVLQCVAVCRSVSRTTNCNTLAHTHDPTSLNPGICCSVLQCVVCSNEFQCIAVHCSALHCVAVHCSVLQCVAVCCSLLHTTHCNKLHVRTTLKSERRLLNPRTCSTRRPLHLPTLISERIPLHLTKIPLNLEDDP